MPVIYRNVFAVRSDTDLISGRAMIMATRGAALWGDAPALGSPLSRPVAPVASVIRSATAVAAATCSCIDLPLEIGAGPTTGCESAMFAPALLESAVALLFGCVLNE